MNVMSDEGDEEARRTIQIKPTLPVHNNQFPGIDSSLKTEKNIN
jgi:hypothetical protein